MGRRRLEVKKIEDNARRRVTFTNRRRDLFKEARELTTECGGEVAIIIFSLPGNMFAFGHPSVDSIVCRFENMAVDDRVNTVVVQEDNEETENVVEEDEEGDDEDDTSAEEIDGEDVVVMKEEEEEELVELDKLEAVAVDMLKEVSRIAKRMVEKM